MHILDEVLECLWLEVQGAVSVALAPWQHAARESWREGLRKTAGSLWDRHRGWEGDGVHCSGFGSGHGRLLILGTRILFRLAQDKSLGK